MSNEQNISPVEREHIEHAIWRPEKGIIVEPQRSGYRPWEPTPGKVSDPRIAESQAEVDRQALSVLLDPRFRPPFADPLHETYVPQLDEFVELVYWSREANREIKNTDSYNHVSGISDKAPEQMAKFDEAQLGRAYPGEILNLIDEFGMESAEIARLTHIYGYRLEFQPAMQDETESAIKERGGEVYDDPVITYDIVAFDTATTLNNHLSIAIAMKRKKLIGHVGDTLIYERSTFIVRIDKGSHINAGLARYLRSIPLRDLFETKKQIMEDGRLVQEVIRLLALDDLESIIPMSSTIFACSSPNHERLYARIRAEGQANNAENRALLPAYEEHKNRTTQRDMGDIAVGGNSSGMITVGVPQGVIDELNMYY